jgi:hypothetical protein
MSSGKYDFLMGSDRSLPLARWCRMEAPSQEASLRPK